MPGTCSMTESSNTDCALSVTGPYESTAMVTGPIPRKPNATKPNANTAGASITSGGSITFPAPMVLKKYAMDIKPTMLSPSQYADKFPATRPERMFSEAPPSRDDVTTSATWLDSVEV